MLFSGHVGGVAFLSMFLNPFFEELIARAYVQTEVRRLTGSATFAVAVSVLLQTSYHFYQGVPAALTNMGGFLVFALYFAKTKRAGAAIVAHMFFDVLPTLFYMARIHQ
jgi:membrane protease YdiL (CAAX protease family)